MNSYFGDDKKQSDPICDNISAQRVLNSHLLKQVKDKKAKCYDHPIEDLEKYLFKTYSIN